MRKLLVLVATASMMLVFALPASAQEMAPCTPTANGQGPAIGCTVAFHNTTQSFPAANPCTGDTGTVATTFNGAFHVTVLVSGTAAGTGWATFTGAGTFVFTPDDPTKATLTGRFTAWDGENFNLTNFAATAIFVLHGTGSDGSTVSLHDVAHITILNPTSSTPTVVVNFDKPTLTCG